MRIKLKEPVDKRYWHKKFIIFPRIIDGHWVFLETIEKRIRFGFYDEWAEYRLIERKEVNESKT